MSQNTRCPSCATLFKVVPDQLRISDGWVRCGQCQEIFDATAHLQALPEPELLPDLLPDLLPAPGSQAQPHSQAAPDSDLPHPPATPVLEVPDALVPAFLIAPPSPPNLAAPIAKMPEPQP